MYSIEVCFPTRTNHPSSSSEGPCGPSSRTRGTLFTWEDAMIIGEPCKLSASECPNCKTVCDRASCVGEDGEPEPGDITVCMTCGHVMAFAENMSLRELNNEEIHKIAGDERILTI